MSSNLDELKAERYSTMKLRFVERRSVASAKPLLILQQWWDAPLPPNGLSQQQKDAWPKGEWRDVPVWIE